MKVNDRDGRVYWATIRCRLPLNNILQCERTILILDDCNAHSCEKQSVRLARLFSIQWIVTEQNRISVYHLLFTHWLNRYKITLSIYVQIWILLYYHSSEVCFFFIFLFEFFFFKVQSDGWTICLILYSMWMAPFRVRLFCNAAIHFDLTDFYVTTFNFTSMKQNENTEKRQRKRNALMNYSSFPPIVQPVHESLFLWLPLRSFHPFKRFTKRFFFY